MDVALERSRIIFSGYTDEEKKKIEDLVATMDKVFTYEDVDNQKIYLPTGMVEPIKRIFPGLYIEDRSATHWAYETFEEYPHKAEPRNQLQIDFIKFVMEQVGQKRKLAGILSPGTGKTFMACYSALKAKVRTLIIVPTTNIKDQWEETLIKMFDVPKERVVNVRSPKDFINVNADFVVVSQASLAVLNKTYDLEKIMKSNKFGIKVIDEVQMWWHNMIKVDGSSNICHNWYLTGTFGRSSDEENRIYQQMFGDLAFFREKQLPPTMFNRNPGNIYGMKPHMHTKMIWTRSGLTKAQIKKVSGSMRYSQRSGKWMRYGISIPAYTSMVIPSDGTMTRFLQKILTVINMANKEVTYGKMLVLTPTVASVLVIERYLKKMYPDKQIGVIHSKQPKAESDRVKKECDIMVSTCKSAGTGFDVKDLSKLVVAEQFKSWILADQVSGRLRKRPDGKDTYMWDIVDAEIKQLRAWAHTRANILRKKSKSFKVVEL